MNMLNSTPYANLNPNLIIEAIESVGYACSGSLFGLNSFENRVYQIGIEDESPIIAKFYRPMRWTNAAILEEHQFAFELNKHEIPVIAPLINSSQQSLHTFKDYRFALFPRQGGRALELDKMEQLEWMGRFIGRLHAVSACRPFQYRNEINVQTHGFNAFHSLVEKGFIPDHLKSNYCGIVEALLQKISDRYHEVGAIDLIRLHGDCHASNVLWNDTGPHIVDLDDCVMGPAIQDIWMLLTDDTVQMDIQLEKILRGYRQFHDFNSRELRLIEALRALRMLHYSAWLANRWEDPAFPQSFPWFNTHYYWQEQLQNLTEQLELLNTSA